MSSTASSSADNHRKPFLDRLKARLQPPRFLALTRAGKFFILMTIGVGFGAINTGNNLLFLIFGMMLSVILASGVLSEAVLRNLRLRRHLPRRLEAGQPAPGSFRLINHGWWPALSIEASEQNPRCIRGPSAGREVGPKSVPWWKFWRRQTDDERRPLAAAYTLRIGADSDSKVRTHYQLPERGEYKLTGLQLTTRFPFSLFEKSRRFAAPSKVTVLPAALPAEQWLGRLDSRWGDTMKNKRGRGDEYFGLRDYRPGEDHRSIHWKSTARRGEPMVRETEARQRRALLIILDNRAPVEEPAAAHRARFELGIRHLAGLLHSLDRDGYRLQLRSSTGDVSPERPGEIDALLRHLATIELARRSAPPPPEDSDNDLPQSRVRIGFEDVLGAAQKDETRLSFEALPEESS